MLSWQLAMQQAITDPEELLHILELDESFLIAAKRAAQLFPLKVPRGFVDRMQKANPNDPLLRQVLPLQAELSPVAGYETDPLHEAKANPLPGLLHKYPGRVLITLVASCGIHCRYCFRRHFPYAENNPGKEGWSRIFNYIAEDPLIQEVILSGGDPLVANDAMLADFTQQLTLLPQIKRLRIHTRMPIVLPERITPQCIAWLESIKIKKIMVVHCNHAQEINPAVTKALTSLAQAGVILLNQSVLLKGVNDHPKTLVELSEALFVAGVLPYYLHVLDKVQGAAHFDQPLERARKIHQAVRDQLSGYLVPQLVREQPEALAKIVF